MKRCPHCGKRIVVEVEVSVRAPAVSTYVREPPPTPAELDAQSRTAAAEHQQWDNARRAIEERWRVTNAERERQWAEKDCPDG